MTPTIQPKCHEIGAVLPLIPAISSLESVPFYADLRSIPQMAVMGLKWTGGTEEINRLKSWAMPLGTVIVGPMPKRFGIQLLRVAEDSYVLNLVWDRTEFAWMELTRAEIQASSLPELLAVLNSNLADMLEQPILEADSLVDSAEFAPESN